MPQQFHYWEFVLWITITIDKYVPEGQFPQLYRNKNSLTPEVLE